MPAPESRTLSVGGAERRYVVHLPRKYDKAKPAPLLVMLTEQGAQPETYDGRGDIIGGAAKLGYLLVVPQMHGSDWQHGACAAAEPKGRAKKPQAAPPAGKKSAADTGAGPGDQAADVAFVTALLEELGKQFSVDQRRVYLVGTDSGAALATQVTRALPGKLSGVAVNASQALCPGGSWQVGATEGMPPVLVIQHPAELLADAAAVDAAPARPNDALNAWLQLNGCTDDARDAAAKERTEYACRTAPVVVETARKGTSRWPRKIGKLYTLRVIHNFFQAQTRT